MKSVLEILEQAKKRVSKSWIQFYFAKDETGKPIMGNDPNAVSWCAVGALSQMGSLWGFSGNVEQARSFIEQQILYEDLACWNNVPGRTQEEVVDLFDRAIKMWEMRGVSAA